MMVLMLLLSFSPIFNNFFPESLFVTFFGHAVLILVVLNLAKREKFVSTFLPLLIITIIYILSISAATLRGHSLLWLIIGAIDNLKTLVPLLLMLALPENYFVPQKYDFKIAKTFGLVLLVSILGAVLAQFSLSIRQYLDVVPVREMIRYGIERSSSIYIGVNMFVKMNIVSFLGMSIRGINIWLALFFWVIVSILTYSRQFILGVLVSLLAGYIMSGVKVTIRKKHLTSLLLVISVIASFFIFSILNSDSSNFSESDGKFTNISESVLRLGVAYASINCALQYPFGAGPGNFGGNIGKKIENNDYLYECGVLDVFPLFDLAIHYTDSQFAELLGSLGFGVIIIFIILYSYIRKVASILNSKGKFLIYTASVFVGIQFLVSPILNYFEFILPFTYLTRTLLVNFKSDQMQI